VLARKNWLCARVATVVGTRSNTRKFVTYTASVDTGKILPAAKDAYLFRLTAN